MDITIETIATTVRVRSATISLRLHSLPLMYVHVESYRLEQDYGRAVREQSRVTLGGQIEGTLIGFQTNRGRDDQHTRITLVVTVVDKSIESWLADKPREGSQKLLVYQRKQGESPRQYLDRLLDMKIDWERAEGLEKENVFLEGACLWRTEDSTNIRFLNDVMAFIRLRLPDLEGWYFVADASKPIRAITRTEHSVDLDGAWRGLDGMETDAIFLPSRGINAERFSTREFTLKRFYFLSNDREKTKLEAIQKLVSKGPPSSAASVPVTDGAGNLIMGPGPVTMGNQSYFAREIQYEVEFEVDVGADNSLEATVYLSTWNDRVAASPFHGLRLPAQFMGWQSASDGCLITDLAPAGAWGLHQDSRIFTHVHTPSFVRDNFRGLYSTYEGGDSLFVEVRAGELPVMKGACQQYATELEAGCMALNAERIATVTLPVSTAIGTQCGFYIQADATIDARTETFVVDSELKQINENWSITKEKTDIVYDVEIDGNVKVYKKLDAGRGMTG